MFRSCSKAVLTCAFLVSTVVATSEQKSTSDPMKVTQLKPDLFEIEGMGSNSFLFVTTEGAALIDAKNLDPEAIAALDHAIHTVTDQPVKYVIITHYHQDHVGAIAYFQEKGAQVISSEKTRQYLLGKEWKTSTVYDTNGRFLRTQISNPTAKLPPTPPRVTFDHEVKIFLGGKVLHAVYLGAAHTGGDIFVFIPSDRAVAVGDDVKPLDGPLIDYPAGGGLLSYIATLDALLKSVDFDLVLPGHGPLSDRAGVEAHRKKLIALRDEMIKMKHAKKSYAEIAAELSKEYGWKAEDRNLGQWTLPGLMTEIK